MQGGHDFDHRLVLGNLKKASELLEKVAYELAGTASQTDVSQLFLMARDAETIALALQEGLDAQKQ